jgi:hypothetical protein
MIALSLRGGGEKKIPGIAGQLRRVFRDHGGGVVFDGQKLETGHP